MLDINTLNSWGADTKDALMRCMGNEDFYLRLVRMSAEDPHFESLEKALEASDWKAAFESAHAIKGVVGNLGLMPLVRPASALTEALRPREAIDYHELLSALKSAENSLKELIAK